MTTTTRPFSPELLSALAQSDVVAVILARIEYESGPALVHTGVGDLQIGGDLYVGVGSLGRISPIEADGDTSAKAVTLSLSGVDRENILIATTERVVGRPVVLRLAVLDRGHRLLAADVIFSGTVTEQRLTSGRRPEYVLTVGSWLEDWKKGLLDRYSDASQQRRHLGDAIFRYMTQVSEMTIRWGTTTTSERYRYE